MKKRVLAPPSSAEREYARAMRDYARQIQADINRILVPRIGDIVAGYRGDSRTDGWIDDLSALLAELLRLALENGRTVINRLPHQFEIIQSFNESEFRAVFKSSTGIALPPKLATVGRTQSLLGVNVFHDEPFLAPLAEGWIAENTALIQSVPTKAIDDVAGIIRRDVMAGKSVRDIAKAVKAKTAMTESRAILIAQDQTLSLHAQLTEHRLKSVGVSKYIWRTVGDSRVRPAHADYAGNEYSFDSPPRDGNPGQAVRCRCRAEAIWPEDEAD